MLEAGIAAPPFTLLDQDANEVSLGDYVGQWVLLWWYPKAATRVERLKDRGSVIEPQTSRRPTP